MRVKKKDFGDSNGFEPIRALTPRQGEYIEAISRFSQVICFGPPGTGKTFIPATMGGDWYRDNKIQRLYLSRPNVPASNRLGFFPGTLDEKMEPWARPLTDRVKGRLAEGAWDTGVKKGNIAVVPFETMRGSSFEDAFIILDEAQNLTYDELKMFLTRTGRNSRIVMCGDVSQTDLGVRSGLRRIIDMVKKYSLPVAIIEFGIEDIVRSDICRQWTVAFMEEEGQTNDTKPIDEVSFLKQSTPAKSV